MTGISSCAELLLWRHDWIGRGWRRGSGKGIQMPRWDLEGCVRNKDCTKRLPKTDIYTPVSPSKVNSIHHHLHLSTLHRLSTVPARPPRTLFQLNHTLPI